MTTDQVPSEIVTPGTHLWRVQPPALPGSLVVIHAQGRYRLARVFKNGPRRAHVEYGTSGTKRRTKAVAHELLYDLEPADPLDENRYATVRQGESVYGGTRARYGHYLEGGEDL